MHEDIICSKMKAICMDDEFKPIVCAQAATVMTAGQLNLMTIKQCWPHLVPRGPTFTCVVKRRMKYFVVTWSEFVCFLLVCWRCASNLSKSFYKMTWNRKQRHQFSAQLHLQQFRCRADKARTEMWLSIWYLVTEQPAIIVRSFRSVETGNWSSQKLPSCLRWVWQPKIRVSAGRNSQNLPERWSPSFLMRKTPQLHERARSQCTKR